MKTLIIYPWMHHSRMVEELARRLSEEGIITDAICINDYELISNSKNIFLPYFCKIGRRLRRYSEKHKREWYSDLFEWHIITLLFRMYDIVDFHAYYNHYYKMINACIKNNIRYDITLWGSDVLRSSKDTFSQMEYGYKNAKHIKGNPNLLERVSIAYNGIYNDKFRETIFGNSNLTNIDSFPLNEFKQEINELIGNINNKIIITVGYNGVPEQQHSLIIDSIKQLPLELKEKIHIVVPMTYSANKGYIDSINTYLCSIGVSYKILTSFLSPKQLALLRQVSNIVINAQTTDAFCGALQEFLYCGNIVMIAEWLNYPLYDRNDVFYIKFSREDLVEKLKQIIENYSFYIKRANDNRMKIYDIVSWNNVISMWSEAYDKHKI